MEKEDDVHVFSDHKQDTLNWKTNGTHELLDLIHFTTNLPTSEDNPIFRVSTRSRVPSR